MIFISKYSYIAYTLQIFFAEKSDSQLLYAYYIQKTHHAQA
jgi:hypothetical protein